jgi:hypothetical protein
MSFAFDPNAVMLLDRLRNPTKMPEFITRAGPSRELAQRIAYVLAITKCLEPADARGMPPPSRPPVHSSGTYSRTISFEMRTPYARSSSPPSSSPVLPAGAESSGRISAVPPDPPSAPGQSASRISAAPISVPAAPNKQTLTPGPERISVTTPMSPIYKPPPSGAPVSKPPVSKPPVSQPVSSPAQVSSPPVSSPPNRISVPTPLSPIMHGPPPSSKPPMSGRPSSANVAVLPTRAEITLKASKIGSESFYDLLGVGRTATPDEVRAAFVRAAPSWRADRLPPEYDDVRDLCAQVQARLEEAYQTLSDPAARSRYDVTGGRARPSSPVDAAKVYKEAEAALENRQLKLAEELCRRAYELAPDVGRYAAMLVWIDAERSVDAPPEHVKPLILKLDRIIGDDPHCEEALFYRATLLKRIGNDDAALRDFNRVVALNPRHIDAAREVRLYEMRKKKR